MSRPQQNEDLYADIDTDSTDDDSDSIFDANDLEHRVSNESDPDTEGEDFFSEDDNDVLPPEHYLAIGDNLDVARLRQEQFDPKTKDQVRRVKDHCNEYENTPPFVITDPYTAFFLVGIVLMSIHLTVSMKI